MSQLPPHLLPTPPPSRRRWWVLGGFVLVGVVVVLAFGVFGIQALWTDEEVSEAAPVFDSGADLPPTDELPATTAPAATTVPPEDGAPPTTTGPTTTTAPVVSVAATGMFVEKGHPGEGTATLLTDGTQTFIRFEDDFSTDNGPDLRVRIVVAGETVDLGELKGNIGAQNYELPVGTDPAAVASVDVWCRRFDYVFTEAVLAPT